MRLVILLGAVLGLQLSSQTIPQVDRYLQPFVENKDFTGAVLIARGGKILVRKGYGMANYELGVPNTPQTVFHIASVSKPFTVAAILLLEERGQLSTDDPVSKFLPDFPNGDRILLRHLLTHTSGIPDVNGLPTYNTDSRFPHTPAQLVAMFQNAPLEYQPGQGYRYSNSNYNLLADVIELLSKKSYGDFMRENIFQRLEMTSTQHDGKAERLIPGRATGYQPVGSNELENAPTLDWSNKTGNGSLVSTVDDLYKFDRALYTEKLLKKASLEKMFASGRGHSFGWFTQTRFGKHLKSSNGRSPGFTSSLERFPDDDACIIVLSNSYAPTSQSPIAEDLSAILFGQAYSPPPRRATLDESALAAQLGSYKFGPDFFRPNTTVKMVRDGDHLLMDWGSGFTSVLVPLSSNEFLDRSIWARVIFQPGQVIYRYGQDYTGKKP